MIHTLDTSELLSTLILTRTKGFVHGYRKLSYDRIFKISHRITDKFDWNIRFNDLNTNAIKAFCNWLIDKGKINISYDDNRITIYPLSNENTSFIYQYAPHNDDYYTIVKANY